MMKLLQNHDTLTQFYCKYTHMHFASAYSGVWAEGASPQ